MEKEGFNISDNVKAQISPSLNGKGNSGQGQKQQKKDYGAILGCTLENCYEVLEAAIQMRKATGKPIAIFLEGEKQ